MNGRKVYEFALTTVPNAIKMCIEEAGIKISDVKKYYSIRLMQKWILLWAKGYINYMTWNLTKILCL